MLTTTLSTLILTIILAVSNAYLSYLIDYCLWPGSIFQRWLPWLGTTLVRKRDPERYATIMQLPNETAKLNNMEQAAQDIFLYKVLSGCIICTNVWIAFATFSILALVGLLPWYWMPVYVVWSSWRLRKLVS